ncbi:MAG: EAL domain-containing protein [Thiohalomonadales bacterium]
MKRILLIEVSATLRHAAKTLARDAGYHVTDVGSFLEGLKTFLEMKANNAVDGVILGWPARTDEYADELYSAFMEPQNHDMGVIVLSHRAETTERSWATKRSNTALVLWDEYQEFIDALKSLVLNAPAISVSEILTQPQKGNLKVLFVDDSPTIRVTYRRLLKNNGYLVDTASCVSEAMEKALNNDYDIVITDYYMPDGTGDVLCAKLRQNSKTAEITSAIITGTYSDKAIISSLAAGAVECMFKNEPKELFIARLKAMSRSIVAMRNIKKDHEHLQGILTSVGEGVYGVTCEGNIIFINPAAKRILGHQEDTQFIGKSAYSIFHNIPEKGGLKSTETCNLQTAYKTGTQLHAWATNFNHANGRGISVECTVYPLYHNEKLEGSVVAFRDVTERRLLLEELKWQATHDPLTKLPNRTYFEQQLIQEVSRLKRSDENSALLYIDLDRFKYINDTAGHMVGDKLLVDVGNQFRSRLRDADTLARIGGDEFAVIMRNVDEQDAYLAADNFRNVLEAYQFVHAGKMYKVNASVGVAYITANTRASGEVLANADIACHIAKSRGRNTTHFFHADNDEISSMDIELGWSARLHDALKNDKFELYYQPILSLADVDFDNLPEGEGTLWPAILETQDINELRYEVLLRLPDSRGNMISPEVFLPTAERFNLMRDIDRWVIKRALADHAKYSQMGRPLTITINLSGQTLEDLELSNYIAGLVEAYKVDATKIVFEITETSAIANLETANRFMNDLKELGCRFALDDFGSGFCSFSHLKYLSVDIIKIDGVFIQGMINDPVDRAIVESIAQIARSVNKTTVAEFVENAALLRLLREIGVDFIQGYYISVPKHSLDLPELSRNALPDVEKEKGVAGSDQSKKHANNSSEPEGEHKPDVVPVIVPLIASQVGVLDVKSSDSLGDTLPSVAAPLSLDTNEAGDTVDDLDWQEEVEDCGHQDDFSRDTSLLSEQLVEPDALHNIEPPEMLSAQISITPEKTLENYGDSNEQNPSESVLQQYQLDGGGGTNAGIEFDLEGFSIEMVDEKNNEVKRAAQNEKLAPIVSSLDAVETVRSSFPSNLNDNNFTVDPEVSEASFDHPNEETSLQNNPPEDASCTKLDDDQDNNLDEISR